MDEDGQTTIENGNCTGHLLIPRILQGDEVTITHRPIFSCFDHGTYGKWLKNIKAWKGEVHIKKWLFSHSFPHYGCSPIVFLRDVTWGLERALKLRASRSVCPAVHLDGSYCRSLGVDAGYPLRPKKVKAKHPKRFPGFPLPSSLARKTKEESQHDFHISKKGSQSLPSSQHTRWCPLLSNPHEHQLTTSI